MPLFGAVQRLKKMATPSWNPPSDEIQFYFKSDGLAYSRNSSGVETPVSGPGLVNLLRLAEQGSSPATPASGEAAMYVKSDGGLYMKNDLGVERGLFVPDPALHQNPDFELGSGTTPDNWSNFFGTGGTWSYDTSSAIQGSRSIKNISVGSAQIQLGSSMFGVTPGATVEISVWAKTSAVATFDIIFLTSTTAGNPDYFGSEMINQSSAQAGNTGWTKHIIQFVVPANHTKARIYFGLTSDRTWWLDASGSRVTAQPAPNNYISTSAAISMDSNVTDYNGSRAHRRGDMITLFIEIRPNINWNTTWVLCTVPAGYRPPVRSWVTGANFNNTKCTLVINTDGSVQTLDPPIANQIVVATLSYCVA